MKVYSIITTFNGAEWIQRALSSLRKSSVPVVSVVVDNASTDGTCTLIENNFPETVLLRQGKNIGFGCANNIGISYALDHGADYVLLLNQDAEILPDMLATMLAVRGDLSEYGILSPMQMTGDGNAVDPVMMINIQVSDSRLLSDLYIGQVQDLYSIKLAPAAVWLIRRDVLEKVGGFDPIFFMYGEDNDYLNRLHHHGYRLGLVPKARARHAHSYKNRSTWPMKKRAYLLYGSMVQCLKHPQWSLMMRAIRCARGWVQWVLRRDANTDAVQNFLLAVIVGVTVLFRSPWIFYHRKICRRSPRAWIAG